MTDDQCFRCKSSLENAEVVPWSNYSLVYCPICGTVNKRPEKAIDDAGKGEA